MPLFPEEQLDSPVGYFPAYPGQSLEGGRWTIARKLGWGPRSSTWLVRDSTREIYQAIKIFTIAATEDSTGNNERNLLLGPLKNIETGVPLLLGSFHEHDAKGRRHLCLVLRAFSTSVEDLRLSNVYDGEYLPLETVQKVIGDISDRLAHLAERKIIHGAVTADNFLFPSVEASHQIQQYVFAPSPSERAQKIVSDDVTYPVVKSQPMPLWYTWDSPSDHFMGETIYLTNYAYARQMSYTVTLDSRQNFLPPETLQSGRVDLKSDIWMLGCTTYLLLTGSMILSDSYVTSPIKTATETLGKLESLLTESGKIAEKDIPSAASFLRSCLAIKPSKRATAVEVLNGGWVKKETLCSCGWNGL